MQPIRVSQNKMKNNYIERQPSSEDNDVQLEKRKRTKYILFLYIKGTKTSTISRLAGRRRKQKLGPDKTELPSKEKRREVYLDIALIDPKKAWSVLLKMRPCT